MMAKQMSDIKLPAHSVKLQPMNRLGMVSRKTYGGRGGVGCFNQIYSHETSPLIRMQLQITSIYSVLIGSSTSSVKHHSESHIIKKRCYETKQSAQWRLESRTPQEKTDRTMMGLTTDIDSQASNIWNRLRRERSLSLRKDLPLCN